MRFSAKTLRLTLQSLQDLAKRPQRRRNGRPKGSRDRAPRRPRKRCHDTDEPSAASDDGEPACIAATDGGEHSVHVAENCAREAAARGIDADSHHPGAARQQTPSRPAPIPRTVPGVASGEGVAGGPAWTHGPQAALPPRWPGNGRHSTFPESGCIGLPWLAMRPPPTLPPTPPAPPAPAPTPPFTAAVQYGPASASAAAAQLNPASFAGLPPSGVASWPGWPGAPFQPPLLGQPAPAPADMRLAAAAAAAVLMWQGLLPPMHSPPPPPDQPLPPQHPPPTSWPCFANFPPPPQARPPGRGPLPPAGSYMGGGGGAGRDFGGGGGGHSSIGSRGWGDGGDGDGRRR